MGKTVNQKRKILDLAYRLEDAGSSLLLLECISKDLANSKKYDARKVISELSKHVKANGGGQPFYATAGGDYLKGIKKLSDAALNYLKKNQ